MERVTRERQEQWERERLASWAMRSGDSRGRQHVEPEHPLRTRFQRDRDRVVHSSSFRRLEYKTQVFVNHEGDNYRTRLTHSLEAAQIGRTVARVLGVNEELVECLVLGHDLGHTPFGHSGERAMNSLMKDHGGFEHNRQTLRILETLEQRYPGFPGLNLTWEVREGIAKHGAESDASAPEEYVPGVPPTLEAQLVDFIDEVAYNNHDIDDGLRSGLISVEQLRATGIFRQAHDQILGEGIRDPRIARHAVVRHIIDRLTGDLIEFTLQGLEKEGIRSVEDVRGVGRRLAGYSAEMTPLVKELKSFLFDNLYRHYRVVRMGDKAQRIIRDLFQAFVSEPLQLPPRFQERVAAEGAHRVTCDYIAGMTDRFAVDEHSRLFDPRQRV